MPRNKNKAGQEAKATVRAWAVETQEVATIVHRVMLAEDVDKVGVETRATVRAWAVERQKVATIVHRVMLAKAVVKVETGVMDKATAEVLVARNTKVVVKANALAEARDVVKV